MRSSGVFKLDKGTGLKMGAEFKSVQQDLDQKIREILEAYAEEKERWLESMLREMVPGRFVDLGIRKNTLLPFRLFGIKVECMDFIGRGIEVMTIRRFGRTVAAKVFVVPFWRGKGDL